MRFKRFWGVLLAVVVVLSCTIAPANAAESQNSNDIILRVAGRVNQRISANSLVNMDNWFSLEKDDIVSFDCTYTPKSASVDFGVIAPDGLFYSLNSTTGSIDKSLRVTQTGQYTIVIRNNASYAITVTGTIKY